nr:MAG TPA: hypothetical protein [Caudoviricetes sp.]
MTQQQTRCRSCSDEGALGLPPGDTDSETSLRTGLGMTELSYERTPSGRTRLVPS